MMTTKTKLLLILLLITIVKTTYAQRIDSFRVNRSVSPQEMYVRVRFPDSTYFISSSLERVALAYPPINIETFYYRSCPSVRSNPTWDTTVFIYAPEPFKIWAWLVPDSPSVAGCTLPGTSRAVDSVFYDSQQSTSIKNAISGNDIFLIYPNPASNILNVAGESGGELKIVDGLGRVMICEVLNRAQHSIDIGGLASGVYYISYYHHGKLLQSRCFRRL